MKELMASYSARAALCIALAGLLLVYPNFLAVFIAAVLISYGVVLARRAVEQISAAARVPITTLFTEVARHDDPPA